MPKRSGLTIICWVGFQCVGMCQNLVPNGDFEVFSLCPTAISQIQRALPWFNARTAVPNGPGATPDYFNACANSTNSIAGLLQNSQGNQPANSGDGYAGMIAYLDGVPNFREYAEVELTQPLEAGVCYELSFYMSLGDSPTNATIGGLGAYFSNEMTMQTSNSALTVAPQLDQLGAFMTDTLGWLYVTSTYEALGGETFLTIGNFHDDANTEVTQLHSSVHPPNCYYYIDDVNLIPVPTACGLLNVDESVAQRVQVTYEAGTGSLHLSTSDVRALRVIMYDGTGRQLLRQTFRGSKSVVLPRWANGILLYVVSDLNGNPVDKGRLLMP